MRVVVLAALCFGGCATKTDDLTALRAEALATTAYYQPIIDQLVVRAQRLRTTYNNDLPGAYNGLAAANIAHDTLGLWSFEQKAPPAASWRPAPNSLLGLRLSVPQQLDDIVKQGDVPHMERLVQDLNSRYVQNIAVVEENLYAVESWLAAWKQLGPASGSNESSPPTPALR